MRGLGKHRIIIVVMPGGGVHGHLGLSVSASHCRAGLFKMEALAPHFRVTPPISLVKIRIAGPFLITDQLEGTLEIADRLLAQGDYHPCPINAGEAE